MRVSLSRVRHAGSKEDAITNAGQGAKLIDLKGKTLMPGFIDAHGHLILASHSLLNANLEGVKSKDELINVSSERCPRFICVKPSVECALADNRQKKTLGQV